MDTGSTSSFKFDPKANAKPFQVHPHYEINLRRGHTRQKSRNLPRVHRSYRTMKVRRTVPRQKLPARANSVISIPRVSVEQSTPSPTPFTVPKKLKGFRMDDKSYSQPSVNVPTATRLEQALSAREMLVELRRKEKAKKSPDSTPRAQLQPVPEIPMENTLKKAETVLKDISKKIDYKQDESTVSNRARHRRLFEEFSKLMPKKRLKPKRNLQPVQPTQPQPTQPQSEPPTIVEVEVPQAFKPKQTTPQRTIAPPTDISVSDQPKRSAKSVIQALKPKTRVKPEEPVRQTLPVGPIHPGQTTSHNIIIPFVPKISVQRNDAYQQYQQKKKLVPANIKRGDSKPAPPLPRLRLDLNKRVEKMEVDPSEIPLVSVIVPMYNVEKYIVAAVKSLIDQTYPGIEIILVDDASRDNTLKVAKKLVNKNPQIRLFKNTKNIGTYVSINLGIMKSKGEFITIMGADDRFSPDKIRLQISMLVKNPKLVAAFCEYQRYHYRSKRILVQEVGESTIMFRKSIIRTIGYYDSVRFGADSEYRDRIKKVYGGSRCGTVRKVLYYALYRPNSLTASGVSRNGSRDRSAYRKAYKDWHRRNKKLFVPFPLERRTFTVPRNLV